MTTTINASTTAGLVQTADTSGSLQLQTANTAALTIDTSQNVGIGTTSPSGAGKTLAIQDAYSSIVAGSTGNANFVSFYSGQTVDPNPSIVFNNSLRFGTATAPTTAGYTERMRIDSSGNVLINTTSSPSIGTVASSSGISRSATDASWTWFAQNSAASGGARGIAIAYSGQTPNSTTSEALFFTDSTSYRFALRSNGGIANYSANNVNISDAREKTNIELAGSYLDKICAIPVKTFNYIDQNLEEDGGLTLGVIAQDVQAVAPELVSESNWGTEEEPKERLSIYQTDLQYALMKAIQELSAKVDAQQQEINALKGAAL